MCNKSHIGERQVVEIAITVLAIAIICDRTLSPPHGGWKIL
ncbi:hypothetical protein V5G28_026810 [Scytonema sp. PRP1]